MDGENATSTVETEAASLEGQQATTSANWNNAHAYGLGVVCLALGLGLGFLLRGSASSAKPANVSAVEQPTESVPTAPVPAAAAITPEQLKHMADKAVEPMLKQLNQSPSDPKLLADVGNKYYAGHQFDTAIEYYTKSVEAKADPNVMVQLANAQHYSGNSEQAIGTLERALRIDPNSANALFNLGMLKWKTRGDAAGAIREWQTLLKKNPNHPNRAQVEEMIARVKQQGSAK